MDAANYDLIISCVLQFFEVVSPTHSTSKIFKKRKKKKKKGACGGSYSLGYLFGTEVVNMELK